MRWKKRFVKSIVSPEEISGELKKLTVEEFVSEIESTIQDNLGKYRIEVLLQSARSFKANVHIEKNVFIAIRYNSRNETMDFALIRNKKRIFGYDNLKQWHFHPHTNLPNTKRTKSQQLQKSYLI